MFAPAISAIQFTCGGTFESYGDGPECRYFREIAWWCRKCWCSSSSGDGPPPESTRIIASRGLPSAVGELHRGLDDHQAPPARLLALRGFGGGMGSALGKAWTTRDPRYLSRSSLIFLYLSLVQGEIVRDSQLPERPFNSSLICVRWRWGVLAA